MSVTNTATANVILNRVASEVGLTPIADPYSSQDPAFIRMRYYMNTAGEELVLAHPWEFLVKSHQILTQEGDDGAYELPDDFSYCLDQTFWERNNEIPLGGPLSAQDWTYLKGRNFANNTFYAKFRFAQGVFNIFPNDPVTPDLDINFEYISKNWVNSSIAPDTFSDEVTIGSDIPLYHKTLISRYIKVKWLEGDGFDTTKAQDDFNQSFSFLSGKNKSAKVLNMGGTPRFPYISYSNIPDTGYGGI